MQSSAPSASVVPLPQRQSHCLLGCVEMRAVSPALIPSAVATVSRFSRAVASVAAGSRRGAGFAAFGKRGVHGLLPAALVPASSSNPALKRDWPKAASVAACRLATPSPSRPRVAASPLALR